MTRPPLNSRIRFLNGHQREATVIEHTERGFKYKGEPYSICPRLGMNMTGEGEVFCDMEDRGYDWTRDIEVIEEEHEQVPLTAHIVAEDPRHPLLCINGPFIYGMHIDPKTGTVDPTRLCICHARSDSECICTL